MNSIHANSATKIISLVRRTIADDQEIYRTINVYYTTNDDANIRIDLALCFNSNDTDFSINFWGYNIKS